MAQITDVGTARVLQAQYVCARCYGRLIATPANDGSRNMQVECINSNCNGQGFVTMTYASKRQAESGSDYQEAYQNLAAALGIRKPRRSQDKILEDLGVKS